MTRFRVDIIFMLTLLSFYFSCFAQENNQSQENSAKENWSILEYSGSRTVKDLRTAMASKGFTWLSGSPADNEKLSIGKNAQFFGFVALRYESGRAANRGVLGRAFFSVIDSEEQKQFLQEAVRVEAEALSKWWQTREDILRLLEDHLYTGEPFDEENLTVIGAEFAKLNATVAIHEARAFAALEDSLSDKQVAQLITWREDPEQAYALSQNNRIIAEEFERDDLKKLEDLYAKAFSWITGTVEKNEVIPLGQPAQFFGFVSIRHKSGHAANRGAIAKSFLDILDKEQKAMIDAAIELQMPVVDQFLEHRYQFLEQLALLRTQTDAFDIDQAMQLAEEMGKLEVEAAWIEAKAYRQIRETMTDNQIVQMMQLRGDYVLNESEVETLSGLDRGAELAILCTGCHGESGEYRSGMIGPTLDGIFDRSIASSDGYEYSDALSRLSADGAWTSESLNQFLAAPQSFVPGTKMNFQGLLNEEDRTAVINYLRQER